MELADTDAAPRKGRLLRRGEVAEILGVSPNTVSRWAREGRLPSVMTLGGHRRFAPEVVDDLAQRTPAGQQSPGAGDEDDET
jgi:excisionase family DNA binding protein